jgi:hypothetical protein
MNDITENLWIHWFRRDKSDSKTADAIGLDLSAPNG